MIAPAERMNANAANALLKTLEEPPAATYLMLVTAAPGRLPATIVSRCRKLPVATRPPEAVLPWLAARGLADPALALAQAGGAPFAALAFADAGWQSERRAWLPRSRDPARLPVLATAARIDAGGKDARRARLPRRSTCCWAGPPISPASPPARRRACIPIAPRALPGSPRGWRRYRCFAIIGRCCGNARCWRTRCSRGSSPRRCCSTTARCSRRPSACRPVAAGQRRRADPTTQSQPTDPDGRETDRFASNAALAASMARPGVLSLNIRERAALYAAYMPFLRGGGIFIPTSRTYTLGEEVFMLLSLMDDPEPHRGPGQGRLGDPRRRAGQPHAGHRRPVHAGRDRRGRPRDDREDSRRDARQFAPHPHDVTAAAGVVRSAIARCRAPPRARPMFVDSHCHLDFPELAARLPELLDAMAAAQVTHALCISVNLPDWPGVHRLATAHPNLYATAGVHPDYEDTPEPSVADLVALAARPKVVAMGETGLDYYRLSGDLEWQRARFRPAHPRRARSRPAAGDPYAPAADDTLAIMRDERADEAGGVMHCFTETWDVAQAALDLGFHISFSGIVTFRNATALKDVATRVPLERMLIETDSPYLAPVPHRGKTNEPSFVPHVAVEIARLRGVPVEAIAAATSANFFRLFGIDPPSGPAAARAEPGR